MDKIITSAVYMLLSSKFFFAESTD